MHKGYSGNELHSELRVPGSVGLTVVAHFTEDGSKLGELFSRDTIIDIEASLNSS